MLSYPEKNFHFEVNGWGGNWGMLDLDEAQHERGESCVVSAPPVVERDL